MPRWAAFPVRAGDVLRLGAARAGVRAYLAIAGGIDTPPALGSRATYLRGALGGIEGRALRKNDTLPLGAAPARRVARRVRPDRRPAYGAEPGSTPCSGPQDDRFTADGHRRPLRRAL